MITRQRLTDTAVVAMCLLWCWALVLATAREGDRLVTFFSSEVTAAWAGALGSIIAVMSGFYLAYRQMQHQAELLRATEDRALGGRLRSAAMLVRSFASAWSTIIKAASEKDDPADFLAFVMEHEFAKPLSSGIFGIDVATLGIPAAIDAINGAKAHIALLEKYALQVSRREHSFNEHQELFYSSIKSLAFIFFSLAKAASHFDPSKELPQFSVSKEDPVYLRVFEEDFGLTPRGRPSPPHPQ